MKSGFVEGMTSSLDAGDQPAAFIAGAEPVSLDGGPRGVLVLHGFGDTPQSVRDLAMTLHAKGWTVRAPALTGHGVTLDLFTRARAVQWLDDGRTSLQQLRDRCASIAIVGQSMGGALATILAAEEEIDALVLLVPFMKLSPRATAFAAFHKIVALVKPLLRSKSEYSILDPEARGQALGKGVATPRLLRELSLVVNQARQAARQVTVPTLVIHSRRDLRITVRDAKAAYAALGASEKRLEWVEHSGHVISVDHDREKVASRTVAWLEAHVPSPEAGASA
jgi:carboxylesterase